MNRIEVRLSLQVVAPLLDAVKAAADSMGTSLAAPLEMGAVDDDMHEVWHDELLRNQNGDVAKLLALFGSEFFAHGVVVFDENNAEPVLRACTAIRLRLRGKFLTGISDELLESGSIEVEKIEEPLRKPFMCYLFLATIQELIIQHIDGTAEES